MKKYKIKYIDLHGTLKTETVEAYSKKDAESRVKYSEIKRIWAVKPCPH